MRAPLRFNEPASSGVLIGMRGVSASTVRRSRMALGESAVGSAAGLATICSFPSSIFVTGGLAVGKKGLEAKLQPISTIADSTIARIMLR